MKTKFTMMLTLFMALIVQISFAQQKTISGTVSDENGLPLIGTTVLVVGTSSGTTTDFDGNYSIRAKTGDVLSYSYVGYATQNITVGASSTINLALQPDNTLDEVVVTGSASGKSIKELSFALGTVNNELLDNVPAASAGQALQGKVSGVSVSPSGGQPVTQNGITEDFGPTGDNGVIWWSNVFVFSDSPNGFGDFGGRLDMRVVNLLDPSQPEFYPATSGDVLDNPEMTTADARVGDGKDFEFRPDIKFFPARGQFHFSHYISKRYANDDNFSDKQLKSFMLEDNRLLLAEAQARLDDPGGAVITVNESSRVTEEHWIN